MHATAKTATHIVSLSEKRREVHTVLMTYLRIALLLLVCVSSGCGLVLDLDPPDPPPSSRFDAGRIDLGVNDLGASDLAIVDATTDGAIDLGEADAEALDADIVDGMTGDSSVPDPCAGRDSGAPCEDDPAGPSLICDEGECVASFCGDGIIDDRTEQCDDANEVSNDGCEPVTCTRTIRCSGATDCPPSPTPCLTPTCVAGHCGFAGHDGPCPFGGAAGTCTGGLCVSRYCGDGTANGSEVCDDGNTDDGDGCDGDCTFSCTADPDCDDGSVCTGTETCNRATHTCTGGTPLVCVDTSACTLDGCDATVGCQHRLIDADGDGFASSRLGGCGSDCDDADPFRHPGAAEVCNSIDDDCNGAVDEDAGAADWFVDRDGDGFGDSATHVSSCTPITGSVRRGGDCFDATGSTTAPIVHPDQPVWFASAYTNGSGSSSYDYDCSGESEPRFTGSAPTCSPIGLGSRNGAGWVGDPPGCGETGTWRECSCITVLINLVCRSADSARVQQCH